MAAKANDRRGTATGATGSRGWFALIAIAGITVFSVVVPAMHLLRPDLDPARRFVSEYAGGPYGALMTAGFVALGAGSLALALGLYRGASPAGRSRAGLILLAVWGVGGLVVAVFPADPQGAPPTTHGAIHGLAAAVAFFSLGPAALLLARRFGRDARWRPFRRTSFVLGLLILAALITLVVSPPEFAGVAQRALLALDIVWLGAAALRLRSVSA